MLPSVNRLTKKKDFDVVFKEGQTIRVDFLWCKVRANNQENPRFGFVVSKKISSKATMRNRIKRQLRAAVMAQLPLVRQNCDVILVALLGLEKKTFSDIQVMVAKSLKKLMAVLPKK